ncbi:MAG: MaoC/PaaZ C-terminal domain-containing protein [Acidimicrobiia bacterium]
MSERRRLPSNSTAPAEIIGIGQVLSRHEVRVDDDLVYAYARAVNDHNPRYADGCAVPPLFTAAVAIPTFQETFQGLLRSRLVRGGGRSPHSDHAVIHHAPVRPGTILHLEGSLYGLQRIRIGIKSTVHIQITDSTGTLLVEHHWTSLHIGAEIDAEIGATLIDDTFPDDARAHPLAVRSIGVDRDQAFRYAGVSHDHAPHALDDEVARGEGHPGKIMQGLCTIGMATAAVVDDAAGGDPERLTRISCRVARPALPQRDLSVSTYRTSDERHVAFEVHQGDTLVLAHGRAVLA